MASSESIFLFLFPYCLVLCHTRRSSFEIIFNHHNPSKLVLTYVWNWFVIAFITRHVSEPYSKTSFTVKCFQTFSAPNSFHFGKYTSCSLYSLWWCTWLSLHHYIRYYPNMEILQLFTKASIVSQQNFSLPDLLSFILKNFSNVWWDIWCRNW